MSMSAANYTIHFTNIGKMIKIYNAIETDADAIRGYESELAALLDDTEDETTTLKDALTVTQSAKTNMKSIKSNLLTVVKNYITSALRKDLGYSGSSTDIIDILEYMYRDMVSAAQSIKGSRTSVTAPTFDTANSGTGSITTPTSLTQMVGSESWEMECTGISSGVSTWSMKGEPDKHKTLSSSLSSGTAYAAKDSNEQSLFSVTLTAYTAGTGYELSGDPSSEYTSWSFTGASKGTNTTASGDVYAYGDDLALEIFNDAGHIFAPDIFDSTTGLGLAVNTDTAGLIYITVTSEGGGYYRCELFKSNTRSAANRVAYTASYNSTGAKTLTAANTSGIAGTINISTLAADSDIYAQVGFHRVRVYKEGDRQDVDEVCRGGRVGDGSITFVAMNTSGLTGSVTYANETGSTSTSGSSSTSPSSATSNSSSTSTTSSETSVSLSLSSASNTTATTLTTSESTATSNSSTSVSTETSHTSATSVTSSTSTSSVSGSTSTTSTSSTSSSDDTAVLVRIGFAFVAGDRIYFKTTNLDEGVFMLFFREALGVAPWYSLTGGQTQADSLAQ